MIRVKADGRASSDIHHVTSSIHIYYATETGNAESLARRAAERAVREGWQALLESLSEARPADLAGPRLALFIVSTWGDGDPPIEAEDFWNDLTRAAIDLSGLRYAVFGLGDRGYADFNGLARNLDERLTGLGAVGLHERVEADVDFDDVYSEWEACIFPLLRKCPGFGVPAA
ncbi:MAG: flavodoxin domain-containing protein [Opitutaceae bacterium]